MERTPSLLPRVLGPGARGYLVAALQVALGVVPADGIFGPATAAEVVRARREFGLSARPHACAEFHARLRLPWPSLFQRCLNLTQVLEGTGFGDANAHDIDGAGLTFGICGFTTAHGEFQQLARAYAAVRPDALRLLPEPLRGEWARLIAAGGTAEEWRCAAFGSGGRVQEEVLAMLRAWGSDPAMRVLQVEMARNRFWFAAARTVHRLGFRSDAAFGLVFDVQVQNGGWRAAHDAHWRALGGPATANERARLEAAARAVAACAKVRWRSDVLARKLLFARGAGTVHGLRLALPPFALRPA